MFLNPSSPPPFLCVVGALSLGSGMVWVRWICFWFGFCFGLFFSSGFGVKRERKGILACPSWEISNSAHDTQQQRSVLKHNLCLAVEV
jgi:hypothetical protein